MRNAQKKNSRLHFGGNDAVRWRALLEKELAKQAGCSVQTVDRAIFRLRKLGLVEVEECHAESGAQTANLYRAKR